MNDLLPRFLRAYPFQPATAYWRAIELECVIEAALPRGRGLDLGCGDGKLTGILLESVGARDLVGLDVDASETALARSSGLYSEVVTASSTDMPFRDEVFDFVYSNSVLEHIHAIEATLDEICRVLKRGGQFVFTVPDEGFHECLRGPWLWWVEREAYVRELDDRTAHLRYWSESRWRDELSKRGLSVASVTHYLREKQLRRWEDLSRMTGGLLYRLYAKKKHPIEIQRKLGMRRQDVELPHRLANAIASVVDTGTAGDGGKTACILIKARKR